MTGMAGALSSSGMSATVILLPSVHEFDRPELIGALGRRGIRLIDLDLPVADAAPFATRVCGAIAAARPASPVLIVAPPTSAAHLPAIGLGQRSAHRRVTAYVVLEPGLIPAPSVPTGGDWPDAPVTCISLQSPEPAWVSLRGWQGLACSNLSQAADVIGKLVDDPSVPSADAVDQFR